MCYTACCQKNMERGPPVQNTGGLLMGTRNALFWIRVSIHSKCYHAHNHMTR